MKPLTKSVGNDARPVVFDVEEVQDEAPEPEKVSKHFGVHLLVSLHALFYLFRFSRALVNVPKVRLIELAVCQRYYRLRPEWSETLANDIPESLCKILPIQTELSTILGWRSSFEAIPSVITAAFYGGVADKLGRRVVLTLICFGELLALASTVSICSLNYFLPARLTWLSSSFLLIGGGNRMFGSILLTIITDTTRYSQRTKLFYFLAMTDALSEITAPPLEAFTMALSLWLSFALATLIFITVFFLIWVLPETKPTYPGFVAASSASEGPQSLPTLNMDVTDIDSRRISHDNVSQPLLKSSGDRNNPYGTSEQKFMQVPEYGSNPWKEMLALLRTPSLLIVLLCLLAKRVGFTSEIFFAQYASERFHLILRQTPWFEWAKAIGSFLALGFALPLITSYLSYWKFSARSIDLGIVRGNLMVLTAGFFVMGIASVPVLYGAALFFCGFGGGAGPALEGLASSFVEPAQNARLFTMIAILDTGGRIVSGPLMAKLLALGRNVRQEPNGMIFMVSSGIFGVSLILSFLIRARS